MRQTTVRNRGNALIPRFCWNFRLFRSAFGLLSNCLVQSFAFRCSAHVIVSLQSAPQCCLIAHLEFWVSFWICQKIEKKSIMRLLNRMGQNSQRGRSPLLCGWSSEATGGSVCSPGRGANFAPSEMAISWLSSHYSSLSAVRSVSSYELISYYPGRTLSGPITALPPIFIGHSPRWISGGDRDPATQKHAARKYSEVGKRRKPSEMEDFSPSEVTDVSPAFGLQRNVTRKQPCWPVSNPWRLQERHLD